MQHRITPKPAVIDTPLLVLALVFGASFTWIWSAKSQPDDWASLWIGGMLIARGQSAHLYDHDPNDFSLFSGQQWADAAANISAEHAHPFVQNPLIAYLLAPVTKLIDYNTSVTVLLFFSGVALTIFIASSFFLWFHRTMPWGFTAVSVSVVSLFPATMLSFSFGQTTPLIVAGVAYGIVASIHRTQLAGIVLGVVSMVKITPLALIVVLLFFPRRRVAGLWALGTSVVWVVATLIVVDGNVLSTWLGRMREIGSAVLVSPVNQAISSMMMFDISDPNDGVSIVSNYPIAVKVLPLIAAVAVTVAALAVAWLNRMYRFEILIVSAWGVATAFSPIVWTHYILAVVVFFAGLIAFEGTRLTRQWPYFVVAALVVILNHPVAYPVAASPESPGFLYAHITALLLAQVFLLVGGVLHAVETNGDQPAEPMILFDRLSKR